MEGPPLGVCPRPEVGDRAIQQPIVVGLKLIRPRMPELLSRLAALLSVLSRFSGHSRPVKDRVRRERDI